MTNNHSSDWDDSELVPLGELRPSREHFGPLVKPADKNRRPEAARPQNAERKIRPEQKSQKPRPAEAKQRPAQNEARPVRREEAPAPRREEAAPQQQQRSQQRPQQRPQQPQRRPDAKRPEVRPARPDAAKNAASKNVSSKTNRPDSRRAESPLIVKPTTTRRGLFSRIGGGKVEADPRELLRAPITDGTLAVFSRKGGVGKTTISAYLGLTLAEERGGRILAIDGDSEAGSLGWLLAPESPAMLASLAAASPAPTDYEGLRQYTAVTPEGLEVVVGDTDEVDTVDPAGLENALVNLAHNYDVSIFDTGGGVSRSAGKVLVKHAKVLLLVMGPSVDSIRAAERTLAWLEERPGVAASPNVKIIAVINGIPNNIKDSQIEQIERHFAPRCAAVVRIPWDEHLATGSSEVSLQRLSKSTRRAFMQLAATTVGVLASNGRRQLQGARRAS